MATKPSSPLTPEIIKTLSAYTACDISDALLKLKVPNAGFIADLTPYYRAPTSSPSSSHQIQIAPASTVHFITKTDPSSSDGLTPSNIPQDQHWADLTPPGTILISSQPEGQTNAVLGGIMAQRMKVLGVSGIVVHGRVRDLEELSASGLTIWAKGTSTVGSGGSAKAHSVNMPVTVSGVEVVPGDLVFSDVQAGVVVIPQGKLREVMELLPKLVEADERVKEAVEGGMSIQEAFAKFR